MIIAINVGQRLIDKLAPQEHREVTEEQAQVYEKLLPNEIKIIRKDEPKLVLDNIEVTGPSQNNVEVDSQDDVEVKDVTIIDLTDKDVLNNEDDII